MPPLIIALIIVLFLTVCFFLGCYICFRITFYNSNKDKTPKRYQMPPGKVYLPYYDKLLSWMKAEENAKSERVTVTSYDGLTLTGTYYENFKGAPVEIMFHGYRGNAKRDMCGGINRCFSLKRNVLAVDHRGHGLSDGNIISQTEPTVKRRVISEKTAQSVISMMEAVVEKGTGKNAYIPGYRVCGKTATAEKLDDNTDDPIYIASFLCFAPADDPQVAILVGVDNAPGPYRGGGVLAAPIAKEVLESTLKYLGVEPHYTQSELASVSRTTPSLIGKSVSDAKIAAANEGLVTRVSGNGKKVVSQVPAGGESIPEGGVVVIYTDDKSKTEEVSVPDFSGHTASEVNRIAVNSGLNVVFSGPASSAGARAYSQDIGKGTKVEAGSKVTVYFRTDNVAID